MPEFTSPLVLLPFLAFVVSVTLHGAALRIFPRLGLLDFPERYGLSRPRIPYPTGVILVGLFAVFFLVLQPLTTENAALLSGIALLAACCMIDDRNPLHPAVRFSVQTAAALLLLAGGIRIDAVTNPLPGILGADTSLVLNAGWPLVLSAVFTVLWLLFTINALNWFDGIGGQVSVLSVIGFLMLGLLAYFRNGEVETAQIAFVLAGIAAAGAAFDFPPATLLLGDTGSMFFGLMLGVLGIYSGGKVATVFLALGIPLLDAAFVIVRRLARGTSPLRGGRDHLHHLLLDKGWSERKIIMLMAVVGTLFGGTALFMSTAQKGVAFVVLLLLMLAVTKYASKRKSK